METHIHHVLILNGLVFVADSTLTKTVTDLWSAIKCTTYGLVYAELAASANDSETTARVGRSLPP